MVRTDVSVAEAWAVLGLQPVRIILHLPFSANPSGLNSACPQYIKGETEKAARTAYKQLAVRSYRLVCMLYSVAEPGLK